MLEQISKLRCIGYFFILTLLCGNPLWADDTEIFFSRASSADIQPNVLFILDGSGSMSWYDCANGSVRSSSCDDGTPNGTTTRLARLKDSLKTVLNNTSNINVGLMRFSHSSSGGRITYPIRNIDQQMCNGVPCSDDSTFTAQSRSRASEDDAAELANGDVNISESTIALTTRVAASTKPVSYEYFEGNWNKLPDFNTLTPVETGTIDNFSIDPATANNHFGFRQQATLEITTAGEYTFYTRSDDGSQLFINDQMIVDNDDLHGMRERSGKITLQPGEYPIIVTYFEKTGGAGLEVMWEGPNFSKRSIDSFVTPAAGENAWVGLRFPDLQIPQGATITDARLDVSSASDSLSTTNLVIHAEDTENSAPFAGDTNNISQRNRSYTSVNWNAIPEWDDDGNYETPDLSSLLQLVVNKPGWCGGNAMGLIIKGSGERLIDAYDGGSGTSPKLRVSYTLDNIPATGGCTTSTFVTRIADPKDDATELIYDNNSYGTGLNYAVAPVAKATYQSYGYVSGFRFREINVPKDAEIVDATLSLTTKNYGWYSSYPSLTLTAHDDANPASLQARTNNLTGRPRTSSVSWDNITSDSDVEVTSPSVKDIVQDLVEKSDWAIGNPMVFLLEEDGSGGHNFLSYDGAPSKAAQLKITFKSNIQNTLDTITGPVTDVRSEIIAEIDSMVANHGTPTVGAMLEARRYFAGDQVKYGLNRYANYTSTSSTGRYSRVSTPDSYTGGTVVRDASCNINAPDGRYCASEHITGSPTYISPFTHECQSNHIVLLTDGEPNADSTAASEVMALTGGGCVDEPGGYGTCGEEIASYLSNYDQHSHSGDQTITTHTIGFNFTTQWLKDVASEGGGGYYTADTASQLSAALANIIDSVQDDGTTFVAPGATVDHFSKISHRNDIYLALFQPKSGPRWVGNLKRYDFSGKPAVLHDANDNPAIDPETGQFYNEAKSIWSATADGNHVPAGGAASRLVPGDRKLYTYTGTSSYLTADSNKFDESNDDITAADLGLSLNDEDEREALLEWARGYDIADEDADSQTTDSRYYLGDPLHSKPVIVTYGGTTAEPDSLIFFGTNEGFLHAINTDTGDEEFAFIPTELLPNLKPQFENSPSANKVYGIDGALSLWKKDINKNGSVDGDDHVYLYTGMRRGGNSYYSLDVTDKESPEFKWQIDGGPGGTDGFSELAQTWSQMVPATIKYGTTTKKVVIFGGGYDVSQDDKLTRSEDSVGRAIYIVDASSGSLLWSGGAGDGDETVKFEEMIYSMPATPKIIDIDGDGAVEQIYIGDMGGRVWRFDIDVTSDDLDITGGIIADLGQDGVLADARRFYHTPDISLSRHNGELLVNIAIGSGFQAHPLDTAIEDRFYLLRYPYEFEGNDKYGMFDDSVTASATGLLTNSSGYRPITESDLFDATDNIIGDGTGEQIKAARQQLANAEGWFIKMEQSGEKILGSSVTFDNTVMFASYIPDGTISGCSPQIGSGVFWAVSLWDATPTEEFDDDESKLSKTDRNKPIPGAGLPPPPQTLILQTTDDEEDPVPGDVQIVTVSGGNTLLTHDGRALIERVYWSEYPNF